MGDEGHPKITDQPPQPQISSHWYRIWIQAHGAQFSGAKNKTWKMPCTD